ncbi:RapZ C-terminal domain-containing protein [Streptomyces mirabilis]|uniref:RapZ C-terminal domain-containing protein n=1 Tax=Streptomyces mirabilis TaxID=68239 RepID=UPI0036BC8A5B
MSNPLPRVVITSYGERWQDPPRDADPVLVLDVSTRLWDPAAGATTRDLVALNGQDQAVRDHVLADPAATPLVEKTGRDVLALLAERPDDAPLHVRVHCWYGRHRAVVMAEAVGEWLAGHGVSAELQHRHINRPLVHKDPTVKDSCVFCRIVAGEEPATIVREWDNTLAIKPRGGVNAGHVLVIPRRHVNNAVVDPAVTGATAIRAAELGAELGCDLNIITSVGATATQTQLHLHFHLVPREAGDGLPLPWTPQQEAARAAAAARSD